MKVPPTEPNEQFTCESIPPDLLAWARQTFDVQEYLDGVREIEETGGHTLESFIAEVQSRVTDS